MAVIVVVLWLMKRVGGCNGCGLWLMKRVGGCNGCGLWLMKRVGGCNCCGALADEEGRWL